MNRDERQSVCVSKWRETGRGTIVASTGFGKSRIAMLIMSMFKGTMCIIVPTTYLKTQWESNLLSNNIKADVFVINTAIKHVKEYDLLILDEVHRFAATTFSKIFTKYKFKFILGLTATYERGDGKHDLLSKYAPVVDVVTIEDSRKFGWVSDYEEYDIIIPVNLAPYKHINSQYQKFFSFFGHDFQLAMSVATNPVEAENYARLMRWSTKEVKAAGVNFIRYMHKRKTWIHTHPKKIEVCKLILDKYPDKKSITFSVYNEQADLISNTHGVSYHTGLTNKQAKANLDLFLSNNERVINTSSKLDEGADIPNLELGIIVSGTSSKSQYTQRRGRVIRKEGVKKALFFNLILEKTQDIAWHKKRESIATPIKLKDLYEL